MYPLYSYRNLLIFLGKIWCCKTPKHWKVKIASTSDDKKISLMAEGHKGFFFSSLVLAILIFQRLGDSVVQYYCMNVI